MRKHGVPYILAALSVLAVSCTAAVSAEVTKLNASQAKEIMDTESGYVILDVRREDEYMDGHIPGAILLTDTEIPEKAEQVLKDKEQKILVYCRSGRRSAASAKELVKMGYTDVCDFGGIMDWTYEIEVPASKEVIADGEHEWLPADCTHPEICRLCGEERGETGDHVWEIQSCTTEKCRVCGKEHYIN